MAFTGQLLVLLALLLCCASARAVAGEDVEDDLLTVAERSDYKATGRAVDVNALIDRLVKRAPHLRRFVFGQTVEGREMIGVQVRREEACGAPAGRRLRVLLLGGIHPGECAPKEALLMILREMALDARHRWLDHLDIVFAPNYNADGNERMDKKNRPGQIGPEDGMGVRPNAQGFDLNREFVKLESPEARGLLKLVNRFRPDVFIDGHTTNGSQHRYALTYDVTHNPAASEATVRFLREEMLPEVTALLEARGTATFYYGNFNKEHTAWRTFGHELRYSTEYMGMRGCLAILSEAYSYIPYRDRIVATKVFVEACLDYAASRRGAVAALIDGARKARPATIPVSAEIAAFDEPYVVRGYDLPDAPEVEKDHSVAFFGRWQPTLSVDRPAAYAFPAGLAAVAEHLRLHGIDVRELDRAETRAAEVYRVEKITRREKAFQKHHLVKLEVTRREGDRTLPAGTWIVPTDQDLGTLAAYLLEPQSDDGLVTWNFFDEHIAEGEDFPVVRLP